MNNRVIDNRFLVQRLDRDAWMDATAVNVVADYLAGYRDVAERFLASRDEPEFKRLERQIAAGPRNRLEEYVTAGKHKSLFMLVMMLTGACNADCTICFTDRRRKAFELGIEERDRVLRQARDLGARFVYVPGEGEPTIDPGFWDFLETCRELNLEAVIFTNGILLSDAVSCQRYWGVDPDSAVRRLLGYPVSLYFKYWSMRPELVGEMMNIAPELYHYTDFKGTPLAAGLLRLISEFPRERIGIEVVVERRNATEAVEQIIPFAEKYGLARIVELAQHNGRLFNRGSFDPSPKQIERARPFLSPTSCSMATCKAVVTSRGFLSPRIAVLEHQIPGEPVHVGKGKLFKLLHHTDYLVERRYDVVNCLCEKIPLELAQVHGRSSEFVPVANIVPTALTAEARHSNRSDRHQGDLE